MTKKTDPPEQTEAFPQPVSRRMRVELEKTYDKAVEKAYQALDRARLQVTYTETSREEFKTSIEMAEKLEGWAVDHGLVIDYPDAMPPAEEQTAIADPEDDAA